MKNNIVIRHILVALTLAGTFFAGTSCLKENFVKCPQEVNTIHIVLDFESETQSGGLHTSGNTAETALVYIFDNTGKYVGKQIISNPVFGQKYPLETTLERGNYNFRVWVNGNAAPYAIAPVYTNAEQLMTDGTLTLNVPADKTVDFGLPLLLHGKSDQETVSGGEKVIEIPLIQNNNDIYLTVKGLARTNNTYSFTIADNNGKYNFDNNYVADFAMFDYTTTTSFIAGSDDIECSLSVLRLGRTRSPEISFVNNATGATVYPVAGQESNLIALILKAYAGQTIDFDRKHTYRIEISFDVNMNVTVTVDGWNINNSGNELYPD